MKYRYKPFSKRTFWSVIVGLPVLVFMFSACDYAEYSKLKVADYTPDFATQLIDAEMNLGDMVAERVKDSTLRVNDKGYYYLTAASTKYSDRLEQALSIPVGQKPAIVDFLIPATVPAYPVTLPKIYTIDAGDSSTRYKRKLKYLVLKSGRAKLHITSNNLGTAVNGTLTFEGIKSPGSTSDISVPISLNAGVTDNVFEADLTGASVTFQPAIANNSVSVKLNMVPVSTGGNYNAGATVKAVISLEEFKIRYVEGNLGKFTLSRDFADTIALKFFNSIFDTANSIYLAEPKLEGNVSSSVGLPCLLNISNVRTYSALGVMRYLALYPNPNLPLNDPANPLYKVLASAVRDNALGSMPNKVTISRTPTVTIDNTNTNVASVVGPISKAPNRLGYTLTLASDSVNASDNQWGFDTSRIAFTGRVTLPLNGKAYYFGIQDYLDINLPSYDINSEIDKVTLKIVAINRLPVNAGANLYFLKDTVVRKLVNGSMQNVTMSMRVDSLDTLKLGSATAYQIAGANTDNNGYVAKGQERTTIKYFTLSRSRYKRLLDMGVNKAQFKAVFTTTGLPNKDVKIYPEYSVKVKVGIRINVRIAGKKI